MSCKIIYLAAAGCFLIPSDDKIIQSFPSHAMFTSHQCVDSLINNEGCHDKETEFVTYEHECIFAVYIVRAMTGCLTLQISANWDWVRDRGKLEMHEHVIDMFSLC